MVQLNLKIEINNISRIEGQGLANEKLNTPYYTMYDD